MSADANNEPAIPDATMEPGGIDPEAKHTLKSCHAVSNGVMLGTTLERFRAIGMPTNVDQAKNLFAAIALVQFPLKKKLSPQDLIRLVAPISACINKATTGTMECKWPGECQHALATVQSH